MESKAETKRPVELFPKLRSCRVGQAKPGDLVYAPGAKGTRVCLTTVLADNDGDPALLVLGPFGAEEFPYIDTRAEGFEVLVIEEAWRISPSSKPENIYLDRPSGQADLIGALCLHKDKIFIQALPKSSPPAKGQALAIFDFETSRTRVARLAGLPVQLVDRH